MTEKMKCPPAHLLGGTLIFNQDRTKIVSFCFLQTSRTTAIVYHAARGARGLHLRPLDPLQLRQGGPLPAQGPEHAGLGARAKRGARGLLAGLSADGGGHGAGAAGGRGHARGGDHDPPRVLQPQPPLRADLPRHPHGQCYSCSKVREDYAITEKAPTSIY